MSLLLDTTSVRMIMFLEFEETLKEADDISQLTKDFLKAWLDILASGNESDKRMLNYLMYMAERLILMRRLLKDTGSIYLHCDPTASHYIKIVMDGIFGRDNFRNEVVWCYSQGGRSKNDFPRKHDIILRYSKTKKYLFNATSIKIPYELLSKNSSDSFTKQDENGRWYKEVYGTGKSKKYKYYKDEGKVPYDWWIDIHQMTGRKSSSKQSEVLGYPTQKPLALLDRIIKASCPEDGVVFDPFCGCGTTGCLSS